MLSLNKEHMHMRRGVGKAGSPTKAASFLLAGILSATLAILPSGPYAFAETPESAGSQEEASEEVQPTRSASSENALDDVQADIASAAVLTINPGKFEKVSGSTNVYHWPNLVIEAADPGRPIYSATIQFTSAIDSADEINVAADGGFTILNANKHGNKTVNNAQGTTASEWQAYLRSNLTIQLASADKTASIRITLSHLHSDRTVEYLAETGHYYELISPGSPVTWTAAYVQAAQREYLGMRGYLATITSKEENDFIASLVRADCWLGATCDSSYINEWAPGVSSTEQYYYWVSGPERGTRIPIKNGGTVFSNWTSGQPDCYQGIELYLHIYGFVSTWNDYRNDHPYAVSYLVEYGDMPEDGVALDGETVKIDITLDPAGNTLSSSISSTKIQLGDTLTFTDSINGEVIPEEYIERTFYIEDKGAEGGWRKLNDYELGANATPMHAGNYKVESSVKDSYKQDYPSEEEKSYTTSITRFTVVPKTLDLTDGEPLALKAYDGTGVFDLSGIDISGRIPEGLDIALSGEPVSITGANVVSAGDKTVVLEGASLTGSDAGDYRLKAMVRIIPRELSISTETNIAKGYVGTTLTTKDGEGLEVKTNLSVRGADAGADVEWLENELASCDGVANGTGVQSSILGAETIVIRSDGKVLDPENPEKGTYKVEVHYANVNPVDDDGMPIEPAGSLNVTKIDDWTYDIGNYILTIKPATITIASRNAGGAAGPSDGDGDMDDSDSGTTFAPIDTTTDIRLDPSATGTIAGDPYFEHESGKPVNILDAIQVRPEGGSDWSDWTSGAGSGSDDSANPDGSDSDSPDNPNAPGTTNPGDPTNPDNPDDPSVPSSPDGSDGSNDPTNPDGSGSDDGTGSGTGTNPGGTTPQLPDGVKVVVTDESGNQVDPTNVTDPGTYEVTVSVKDPDTGEFVVIETIKFHVVDTSITDTDYIYKDVAKDHWGHDYIFDIGPKVINGAFNPSDVALGYMAGYAGTTNFGPHNDIIRGDAAIVIWRMAGCPDVEGDANDPDSSKLLSFANTYYTGFTDCDANPTMYWNEAIRWCASNGIVTGYEGTGEYRPQNQITREEFASIIARYASFKGKDVASATADLSQYPDIDDVSDWAAPNMHYVVANGIMTGKGTDEGTADGTHGILDPQANVTRAEVAKMTYMEQPYKL